MHRAYIDLYRDHALAGVDESGKRVAPTLPKGPETDAYMERVKQAALQTADPYALAEEQAKAQENGDAQNALALFVAYRFALARDRGASYDPATDAPTQERARTLPPAAAQEAIDKGAQYVARHYRSQS